MPIAFGSAGPHTEEGRAFFQSRLALFGRWVFLISGAFYLVDLSMNAALHRPFEVGMALHLVATLVAGAIWAIGRTATPSLSVLRAVDATGTLLLNTGYALMAGAFALAHLALGFDPLHALSVGLLACSYVLFTRAIALPSTAARTAWISAVAATPMVAAAAYVLSDPRTPPASRGGHFDVVSWIVAAVVMAVITSRVIFGLRAEVNSIRRLGQYTLEEKIGEGGMGVVYRARHALLRRPTAIKLLAPDRAGEENIQRFEREVQLTASLSHPSTVAVFDYGRTPDGVFYYAMEDRKSTRLNSSH